MPKQKKPPKNAYYFFMADRKKELESQGYRFPGGMKDVANAVYDDWKRLNPNEKVKYEELAKKAKEEDKLNLHNKFTVTGESYAQVNARMKQADEDQKALDELINCITGDTELLDARCFVVMKTINSCEVSGATPAFYPVELAMGSFNLEDGMKKNYWTLIDTGKTPTGYASIAKETYEDTMLPPPGSSLFKPEHKDYKKIIRNVRKFIEHFVVPYKGSYGVFVMTEDLKAVQGSIEWLVEKAWEAAGEAEERDENRDFFSKVKLCKLPVLLLKLAKVAKARDQNYNHVIAIYSHLEEAAVRVLSEGCFDYRDDITCSFHNQEEQSIKMHVCCRNVVLRRIYLIIKEIVPHMGIEMTPGHDIESFHLRGKPPAYNLPRPQAQALPEVKPEEKESSALASLWAGSSSRNGAPKVESPASSPEENPPVVSDLATGAKRKAEESPSGWGIPTASTKFLKTSTSSYENAESTFSWGRRPEAQAVNLRISDDDAFPTLGNSGAQNTHTGNLGWGNRSHGANPAPAGRGAGGAGLGAPPRNTYDNDFPGASSSSWGGMGRGSTSRGRR